MPLGSEFDQVIGFAALVWLVVLSRAADSFAAERYQLTGGLVEPFAAGVAIAGCHQGLVTNRPEGVFAGGRQLGVIQQRVGGAAGQIAASGCVLAAAFQHGEL